MINKTGAYSQWQVVCVARSQPGFNPQHPYMVLPKNHWKWFLSVEPRGSLEHHKLWLRHKNKIVFPCCSFWISRSIPSATGLPLHWYMCSTETHLLIWIQTNFPCSFILSFIFVLFFDFLGVHFFLLLNFTLLGSLYRIYNFLPLYYFFCYNLEILPYKLNSKILVFSFFWYQAMILNHFNPSTFFMTTSVM